MSKENKIVVIDNGTQYGQLYAKRLRDLGVEVDSIDAGIYEEKGKLVRPFVSLYDVIGYSGIVIAGGKSSVTVNDEERVNIDPKIYHEFDNPILGTCFGHQDMADRMGGRVETGLVQCGPVYTKVDLNNPLFKGLEKEIQRVNSTHFDGVSLLPPRFKIIATSSETLPNGEVDAMCKEPHGIKNNWRFGTQFHPETYLTENGNHMLTNFVNLCGLKLKKVEQEVKRTPNIDKIVQEQYQKIREIVGDLPVFLPISGGVDSTTATQALIAAGIPEEKIYAFHIDTGFNRFEESAEVVKEYHKLGWNFVKLINKKEYFANFSLTDQELIELKREKLVERGFGGIKLKDATYSEHKRILFQTGYARIIKEVQKEYGLDATNSILVQGTNQADKVESGKGGKKKSGSAHIKTHHNVGKFDEEYKKEEHLLEPLDRFFKTDIYSLAKSYGLPTYFSTRKPFPGPGLLIRIGNNNMVENGFYKQEDIDELSKIANDFSGQYEISTYVTPLEAVGTAGDERAEGLISVIQFKEGHNFDVLEDIETLQYVAGQIPHFTTLSRNKCITRVITPLTEFNYSGESTFTPIKNSGEDVEALQIFDSEVNRIVDQLGIQMTQTVNYMISDNLGQEGKYTFVFRPWKAPDLMSGMAMIPAKNSDGGFNIKREVLFNELRKLENRYDSTGHVCIDLTYKPIGGTEIN